MGLLDLITGCVLSLFCFCVCRSQRLSPRPTELSFSLEQSRHRPQPDLYLWATVAGRVYVITPEKHAGWGKGVCFRYLRETAETTALSLGWKYSFAAVLMRAPFLIFREILPPGGTTPNVPNISISCMAFGSNV